MLIWFFVLREFKLKREREREFGFSERELKSLKKKKKTRKIHLTFLKLKPWVRIPCLIFVAIPPCIMILSSFKLLS